MRCSVGKGSLGAEGSPFVGCEHPGRDGAGSAPTRSSWSRMPHVRRIMACLAGTVAATAVLAGALAGPARAASPEVIAQFKPGVTSAQAYAAVAAAGGQVTRDLHIINGLGVAASPASRRQLAADEAVSQITDNSGVKSTGTTLVDSTRLADSYSASVFAEKLWNGKLLTGDGIGVAVIDTGVAGDVPDFQVSETDASSRVVASVVTNPDATTANDAYGHGTHVAGILAGNGTNRSTGDALDGKHVGVAPKADLVSIKASDDLGNATVLDVIYGVQFAVDHAADYNIRVINLSLESSAPQSYKTDPLDAAVESAWFKGIVVVAAAGNRGTASDAVNYAPGNDPYVISVGGADDRGTKGTADDDSTPWGSIGRTQDGFAKPEVIAPGAHIVSTLAPNSAFARMCPGCVRDGSYFQAGGTSMSAPVVSGVVALLLQKHPTWTPDQVKGALMKSSRPLSGGRTDLREVVADKALTATAIANAGLTPNTYVNAATGDIDYVRASWSRASWSSAADALRASWSRASWSCVCDGFSGASVDPTRASWSRASWSTSWDK
jgi:serine protease AprX